MFAYQFSCCKLSLIVADSKVVKNSLHIVLHGQEYIYQPFFFLVRLPFLYDVPSHEVYIDNETPLYELLKTKELPVNSYHHQGIRLLSDELKPMAKSPDGLVEAVYSPKHKFLWAVQWHPEFSYTKDDNSMNIFKEFIRHC